MGITGSEASQRTESLGAGLLANKRGLEAMVDLGKRGWRVWRREGFASLVRKTRAKIQRKIRGAIVRRRAGRLPSDELIFRVVGAPDTEWFVKSGAMSVCDIQRALGVLGTTITHYPRVLDFGCGCGRVLLHLREAAQRTELYGVDIDADAIAWDQKHIKYARCSVNNPLPPLAFADGFFDLIYNYSVLTHLDEQYQDAWLAELERVVRPDGIVILTVHGDFALESWAKTQRDIGVDPSPFIETVRSKGILFIRDRVWKGVFPDFYHSTFHAPWYVMQHWNKYFDVKAYIPRGGLTYQDLVLLQRRVPAASS